MRLSVSEDFDFPQAICSYGYFLLAPNRWRPEEQVLERLWRPAEFALAEGEAVRVRVHQSGGTGEALTIDCDRSLTAAEQRAIRRGVVRITRCDADLAAWYRRSAAAKRRRFGRLFRSPTLFEDMVKTITNCNVTWPSTVRMNHLLVTKIGGGAFPTPTQLARLTPARLQKRCGVGYRAKRIVGLARAFESGHIDAKWYESDDRTPAELSEAIRKLDGFGPYATANVLQLLGHYEDLPIDTETIRLYCKLTGTSRPANDRELHDAIEARYSRFGRYRFLAYWFDLWRDYEAVRGPAVEWDPGEVAASFTASRMKPSAD